MNLLSRYLPPPPRSWTRRFVVALLILGAGLWAWLHWSPPPPNEPAMLAPPVKPEVRTNLMAASDGSSNLLEMLTNRPRPVPPPWPPGTRGASGVSTQLVSRREDRGASVTAPGTWSPRSVQSILETQIALARMALSPGAIDGVLGSRTTHALQAFQRQQGLRPTGMLDAPTKSRLRLEAPPYTNHVVTLADLGQLDEPATGWLEKSRRLRLGYETLDELIGERYQSDPVFIRQLNQGLDWAQVTAGSSLIVPQVMRPEPPEKAAWIKILLGQRTLRAFDEQTNLLAHFPCSVARLAEKRPVGELHVAVLITNPTYTFDPENFPTAPESRDPGTKLTIPPGANNPVGLVWIGLDREGYGIHGSPHPERVGQAESLGCFRLANWNAEYLLRLAWVGLPVRVEP